MDHDVFISYSHQDQNFLDELHLQLRPYETNNIVSFWDDTKISPGESWFEEIQQAILSTKVAVFLVSADFLNSKFIQHHELPILLQRARTQGVRLLWVAVRPCYKNHELARFQALTDSVLNQIDRREREVIWVNICEQIAQAVAEWDEEFGIDIPQPTEWQNIHIFTSVKGGVGKTLISLAAICSYVFRNLGTGNGKVLAVDANTMNMDLFNILADPQNMSSLPTWQCSTIDETNGSHVIRRAVPYVLPQGIINFWKELRQLADSGAFKHHDIVVDTNMHIANLVVGPPDNVHTRPQEVINRLLEPDCQRRLYIWILWTFASLKNPEFVKTGIDIFMNHLDPAAAERVNFVHVLNPSALIAPQNRLYEEFKILYDIGVLQHKFDELIDALPIDAPNRQILIEMRDHSIRERLLSDLNWSNLDPNNPLFYYPGLEPLVKSEKVVEAISYDDLIENVGAMITQYGETTLLRDIFKEIYETKFHGQGRPRNLLPIYIYDPGLHGYTERSDFGPLSNIDLLREHLGELQLIVDRFLTSLLRS